MNNFKFRITKLGTIILDCLFIYFSFTLSGLIEGVIVTSPEVFILAAITALLHLIFSLIFRINKIMWRQADFKEFIKIFLVLTVTFGVSLIPTFVFYFVLRANLFSVLIFAYAFSFTIVLAFKLLYCLWYYMHNKRRHQGIYVKDLPENATMVVGAGWAGRKFYDENSLSRTDYSIKVFVDDDAVNKVGMEYNNIKIAGCTNDIKHLVNEYRIRKIVFAIPSCDLENKQRIMNIILSTDCEVLTLPDINALTQNSRLFQSPKKVEIEDLLGRDVQVFKKPEIGEMLKNKVCLVTGGGGSIGSELCRQIAGYSPKKLVIIDFYENNAYDIEQELRIKYNDTLDFYVEIINVTDRPKLETIFQRFPIELVFHAAAYKHVPLMEKSPDLAIRNNVIGTKNVAELSDIYGVKKMLMISSDKAVNPTNIMGASKRLCEMVIQHSARKAKTTDYCCVRFGNVLGSNGSVVPLFKKQIAMGAPISVTHSDMIRYFMTIPEAVSLVLEAAAFATGGEIFILDMGQPVRILDMAERLIKLMGLVPYKDVPIIITGLRPGEKLYEELLMKDEGKRNTTNSKIFIGSPIEFDDSTFLKSLQELFVLCEKREMDAIRKKVVNITKTYKITPNN